MAVAPRVSRPGHGRIEGADVAWALALFAGFLAAKWLVTVVPYAGISITDEVVYWRLAELLSRFALPETAQYPPLYPFLLAPAFWFAGGSLKVIAALNVVYSALSIVPVFALARMLLPRTQAVLAAAVTCLLPWHYVMPRTMLSENVYTGLVVLALVMAVWAPRRNRFAWDAALGALLGALYLTRYISLVLIPVLLVVWWLREWGQEAGEGYAYSRRARLARFAVVIGVAALTFGWWVVLQAARPETAATDALGFIITGRTDPAQLTLDRLWLYVQWYAAYFVLMAAPVAGLLALSVRQGVAEWVAARYPTLHARVVAASVLVGGALFVAVARHSWRAFYNYPDPVRIMGRYLVFMGPLFVVLAFAALWALARYPVRSRLAAGAGILGVPAALVLVAHRVVVGDWLLAFDIRNLNDRGSVDGFAAHLLGGAYLPLVLAPLAAAAAIVLWRPAWRWRAHGVAALLVVALAWPAPAYLAHLRGYQDAAAHGAQMHRAFEQLPPAGRDIVVRASDRAIAASGLRSALGSTQAVNAFVTTARINIQVRGLGANVIHSKDGLPADYVLLTAAELPPAQTPVATWEVRDMRFALVESPDSDAPFGGHQP